MAVFATTISVGATATTSLVAVGTTVFPSATYWIANAGAATVFVGGTPVGGFNAGGTALTTGYPLNTGATLSVVLEGGEAIYGWVSSGTGDLRVFGVTGSR
jgi:hypothetical protein